MALKAKITATETELVGVTRPLVVASKDEKCIAEVAIPPSLEQKSLRAHTGCVQYAEKCIDVGNVNTKDRLTLTEADRQNMLGRKGDDWENYAQHHLGVDDNMPYQTRMRHTHPVVKDGTCYVRELKRAALDDNHEVAKCAKGLCKRAGVEMPGDDTNMEEKD